MFAILPGVIEQLPDLLAWIEPRALLLALALPPLIRVVGHWIPEELFMVAMGVLAARSGSLEQAVVLLGAVTLSHFMTDQITYLLGCWLKTRVGRFPWIAKRLESVTFRLAGSPGALWGLVPARVLPLGRGAWLAGCGMVGIAWKRFAAVDFRASGAPGGMVRPGLVVVLRYWPSAALRRGWEDCWNLGGHRPRGGGCSLSALAFSGAFAAG